MRIYKDSIFEQIVANYKKKIDLGLLSEHQKLASCRELAMQMGINPNTVQKAYTVLENEGYVYSMPKKGVFVAPRDRKAERENTAREQLQQIKKAGISKGTLLSLVDEIYGDDDDTDN